MNNLTLFVFLSALGALVVQNQVRHFRKKPRLLGSPEIVGKS